MGKFVSAIYKEKSCLLVLVSIIIIRCEVTLHLAAHDDHGTYTQTLRETFP